MEPTAGYSFKIASEDWEFEQIHRLNYRTFVEEIPQHMANSSQRLVDRFHTENTYVVCLYSEQVVGMVSVRDKRPFSLDEKLEDLEAHLPPRPGPLCEIRLLSVDKEHRSGRVFFGMMRLLERYLKGAGYGLALISGTTRELKLYRHLGFKPFGPLTGDPGAQYQPMYITLNLYEEQSKSFQRVLSAPPITQAQVNLSPGPVNIHTDVRRSFADLPVPHRSKRFMSDFKETQAALCKLAGARYVQIMSGSGSLGNEAVAAQLSQIDGQGLVLCNGEFGSRLVDQATRIGLSFETLQVEWGQPVEHAALERALDRRRDAPFEWLWVVHSETSTGVLNDLEMLKRVCVRRGIRLCLDCISSIGTVPLDLHDVYLASISSGKGLGAYPGLAMVFHNHEIEPSPDSLPRYLDLGLYAAKQGVPFTISSNLVYALQTAVGRLQPERRYAEIRDLAEWLRPRLRELGLHIVAADEHAAPAVITVVVPAPLHSGDVGHRLEEAGYLLSFGSDYLLTRNWIQICLLGECTRAMVIPLLKVLQDVCQPVAA